MNSASSHWTAAYKTQVFIDTDQIHTPPCTQSSVILSHTCKHIIGGSCRKYHFCCDKSFVATNFVLILLQQKFCCGKYTFVTTKDVFCHNKHMFVAANTCLSLRKFCHNESDTFGSCANDANMSVILSLFLSLSHTHVRTHARMHTHTHAWTHVYNSTPRETGHTESTFAAKTALKTHLFQTYYCCSLSVPSNHFSWLLCVCVCVSLFVYLCIWLTASVCDL